MTTIDDLAQELHLPLLVAAFRQSQPDGDLAKTASGAFVISYESCEVECTNWNEPGWPRSLKPAFNIAVRAAGRTDVLLAITYRENAPGDFKLDGTQVLNDEAIIKNLLQENEPALKTIAGIIGKGIAPAFPTLGALLQAGMP